ncbi:MAG: TetR/AcrR family transcriptional regulator [Desulfatiglandaceae bacterium]
MKKLISRNKSDKEAVIFEAALKTIKQKGYHRARISDIAHAAGISYGLVYHYFKNKEDLFDTIFRQWWEGLLGLMADISHREHPIAEKLKQIILYFFDTYQTDPELVNVFITEISRSTANLTASRLNYFKDFMERVEGLIQEGQRRGAFRKDLNARYLTYIFLGAIETFLSAMVLEDRKIKGGAQKNGIADTIIDVFLNGARDQRNRG